MVELVTWKESACAGAAEVERERERREKKTGRDLRVCISVFFLVVE